MINLRVIIISNGDFDIKTFNKHKTLKDLIICADGGANHIYKTDIVPHMIVGDLDSLNEETHRYFKEKKVVFHKFPARKDKTDTELAVDFALRKKPSEIILFGSTGTRLDHTLANIMLLYKLLKQDIKASIIDETNEIYIVEKHMLIAKEEDTFISFIPLFDKCSGVTLKGFKYPTDNMDFKLGSTMGISNEVIEDKARIDIESGVSLVIKSKDK